MMMRVRSPDLPVPIRLSRAVVPRRSGGPLVRRFLACLGLLIFLAVLQPAQAVLPIEHWTTSKGARVLFVRADPIPMLDISIHFDAGGRHGAAGRAGLATLAAALIDAGTPGLDEDAINERFALTGAQRSASASADGTAVSLRSLTSPAQLAEAVDLLARLLAAPTFPAPVLEREKERMIARLREAQTQPGAIAQRRYDALLYGDHPYGRSATPETVAAVTRDDLVDFHARHFGAARAVIAMIGAIGRADAEQLAERLTRDLPAGDPAPVREPLPAEPPSGVTRIDHPATQSHLLIGFRGIAQHDPDLLALQLANHVLGGGGFTSRLYAEVREKRGLAYSVYSYFSPRAQVGPFTIGLQTRKDQADEALAVVRETLARFVREGPSAAELEAARANLIAGFPLRIDSNRKILGQLSAIGVHGLPLDWLERWRDRVAALTLEDVRAAIVRHMHPDRLVTVIVGAPQAPAQ